MIRAGISIRAAIEGIAEQAANPKFKAMLVQMKKDVEGGKQFSDALIRYPKVFSPLYINMVKASELSGGFSKMLDRIAAYLAQQIETRSMVVGAMIYPGIIGTMAIGTTIFLLDVRAAAVHGDLQGQGSRPARADQAAAGAVAASWSTTGTSCWSRRRGGGVGLRPDAPDRLGPHLVRQGEADGPAVQEAVPRPVHQPQPAHDGPAHQRRRADPRHASASPPTSAATSSTAACGGPSSRAVKQGKKISAPAAQKPPAAPRRSCR